MAAKNASQSLHHPLLLKQDLIAKPMHLFSVVVVVVVVVSNVSL